MIHSKTHSLSVKIRKSPANARGHILGINYMHLFGNSHSSFTTKLNLSDKNGKKNRLIQEIVHNQQDGGLVFFIFEYVRWENGAGGCSGWLDVR